MPGNESDAAPDATLPPDTVVPTTPDGTAETGDETETPAVVVETQLEDDTAVARVEPAFLASAVEDALARAVDGEAPSLILELNTGDASAVEVNLPTGALAALARQEGACLTVASPVAQITFDFAALSAILGQSGEEFMLAAGPAPAESMNQAQTTAAGQFPVVDLSLRSDGQIISDFEGGTAAVTLPHDLPLGQSPMGVVVWYLDEQGGITPCETIYYPMTDEVVFTTTHFSKYVIAYNASLVPVPSQRPVYTLPEDVRMHLVLPLTIAGTVVVLLIFLGLLLQLLFTGRPRHRRR